MLAAELDVSEYAVRRVLDRLERAPAELEPATTLAPTEETGHPDIPTPGNGGRPESPDLTPAGPG